MNDLLGKPRFPLGDIYLSPGADQLVRNGLLADLYIDRHWRGDWGDIDDEDKQTNEQAIERDERLLSAYETKLGKIWVITESDRSHTTMLTPDEY